MRLPRHSEIVTFLGSGHKHEGLRIGFPKSEKMGHTVIVLEVDLQIRIRDISLHSRVRFRWFHIAHFDRHLHDDVPILLRSDVSALYIDSLGIKHAYRTITIRLRGGLGGKHVPIRFHRVPP